MGTQSTLSEVPFRLDDSSGLLSGLEKGVAVASKQCVHMAKQSLHLTVAAACPIVDGHLTTSHFLQHHLNTDKCVLLRLLLRPLCSMALRFDSVDID